MPEVAKPQLLGSSNVALSTHVVFIISGVAQKLMSISTPSKRLHFKFEYKFVNSSFENSCLPKKRSLSSFWMQNTSI